MSSQGGEHQLCKEEKEGEKGFLNKFIRQVRKKRSARKRTTTSRVIMT